MRRSTPIVIITAVGLVFGSIVPRSSKAQEAEPDQTVLLTNIEFKPNRIKVAVGDRVRFINKDKFDHDVYLVRTANRNDVMVPTTTIHAGESVVVTIEQEGLFTLYCTIHGGMTGKITTTDTFELTEEEKKRAAARIVIPPIVKVGEELYWGRGQCHRCHMVGERGDNLRGPNHQDLGFRAAARAQTLGMSSGTEYIVQSILDPSAHIVEGYSDDMPNVYQPPINMGKEEITALVAYLQSQGGKVDSWSINLNPQTLATKLEPTPFRHGDSRRGEKVFQEMGCGSCHTVGDRPGISIAPDLTAIGAFRNWTWLAESIVDPNAEIGANWQDATVFLKPGVTLELDQGFASDELFDEEEFPEEEAESAGSSNSLNELALARAEMEKIREHILRLEAQGAAPKRESASSVDKDRAFNQVDAVEQAEGLVQPAEDDDDFEFGESVPGVLRKNTAEEVTLLIAPDRFATFTGDQVVRVKLSKGSRMASDYGELMTFQQMADLVRYLESLKGPKEQQAAAGSTTPTHMGHGVSVGAARDDTGTKK